MISGNYKVMIESMKAGGFWFVTVKNFIRVGNYVFRTLGVPPI